MSCGLAAIAQYPTGFKLARTLTMPPGPKGTRCTGNLYKPPRGVASICLVSRAFQSSSCISHSKCDSTKREHIKATNFCTTSI
jgi:hypothetical protein